MAAVADRCLSGPHTQVAIERLQKLREKSKKMPTVNPEDVDDRRLNPYHRDYEPATAWKFFTAKTAPESADALEKTETNGRTIFGIAALWRWRKAFLDPNDPVCDRCAVFLRRGRVGRSTDWPDFYLGSSDRGTCDTGGDGPCAQCDGGNCETLALPANNWSVREYVRGRFWHWYEGVGKVDCDNCHKNGLELGVICDAWQEGGCSACKQKGLECLIKGHPHGSVAERLERRGELRNQVLQVFRDPRDAGLDLTHLYATSRGVASAPAAVEPPAERLTEAFPDPRIPAFLQGTVYFASYDQARAALLKGGAVEIKVEGEDEDVKLPTPKCKRCNKLNIECTFEKPENKSCDKCKGSKSKCRFDPKINIGEPKAEHVMRAEWDSALRAPNGRWLRDDEKDTDMGGTGQSEAEKAAEQAAANAAAKTAADDQAAAVRAALLGAFGDQAKAAAEKAAAEKQAAAASGAFPNPSEEEKIYQDTIKEIQEWKEKKIGPIYDKMRAEISKFTKSLREYPDYRDRFEKFLTDKWPDSRQGLDVDLGNQSYEEMRSAVILARTSPLPSSSSPTDVLGETLNLALAWSHANAKEDAWISQVIKSCRHFAMIHEFRKEQRETKMYQLLGFTYALQAFARDIEARYNACVQWGQQIGDHNHIHNRYNLFLAKVQSGFVISQEEIPQRWMRALGNIIKYGNIEADRLTQLTQWHDQVWSLATLMAFIQDEHDRATAQIANGAPKIAVGGFKLAPKLDAWTLAWAKFHPAWETLKNGYRLGDVQYEGDLILLERFIALKVVKKKAAEEGAAEEKAGEEKTGEEKIVEEQAVEEQTVEEQVDVEMTDV
ncbi:hypothetical protein E8E14_014675 [Neopestalotiopsis sp. 37M]|nr:hypothetical protein E8E14_014675 [Neopestalotiopsis sp. 37M]